MIQNAMPSECYDSECNAVRVLWFRVQCHQSAIIIIKKISRAPIYHTRWQHRALYNNTNHTHTHTHTHSHGSAMHQIVCFLRPALWMRELDPDGCDREGSSLGNAVFLTTCPSRGDGPQVQPSRCTPDGGACGTTGPPLHTVQWGNKCQASVCYSL